ncbi:Phosphoenolpyruvate/pyruvate domain-containing protein [Xylariaceae sp. FL0255]|nr:Phosphoenolpyruvate/pyruvate domain-containing protein [Xylariaceae sp. FL0255]
MASSSTPSATPPTPAPGAAAATYLASLHVPGDPVILPNIWDIASLNTVLSLNTKQDRPVKALATASFAIAESLGLKDEDLSLGANLIRIGTLMPRIRAAGIPLSVDIQDGYGDRLDEVVRAVVRLGAAGANVEDLLPPERDATVVVVKGKDGKEGRRNRLYSLEEQVSRLKRVKQVAAEAGCPDFVLNARCDVFSPASQFATTPTPTVTQHDDHLNASPEQLKEAVTRGKAYLSAGATTVYFWGGATRGLRNQEVEELVRALGGRINVKQGMAKGLVGKAEEFENALSVEELAEMGVARISLGPGLWVAAKEAVLQTAERVVSGGGV